MATAQLLLLLLSLAAPPTLCPRAPRHVPHNVAVNWNHVGPPRVHFVTMKQRGSVGGEGDEKLVGKEKREKKSGASWSEETMKSAEWWMRRRRVCNVLPQGLVNWKCRIHTGNIFLTWERGFKLFGPKGGLWVIRFCSTDSELQKHWKHLILKLGFWILWFLRFWSFI